MSYPASVAVSTEWPNSETWGPLRRTFMMVYLKKVYCTVMELIHYACEEGLKRMNEVPACRGCTKTEAQVDMCRIRIYQFNVFGMKCPQEKPIEAIPTLEEPKPAGFEPTTPKETFARTDVLTTNIRLAELETNVFSPRKSFSMRYIDELAEDIARSGQLKPIIVRPHPTKPNVYEMIDGEHRFRALRKLGRSLIRAEVRMLSDEEADLLAMRINQMHGKRLEDLEEGLHIKKMMEQHGWSQRDIAESLRRSLGWVNGRLALANKLSPETKEAFTRVNITKRKAIEIAELPKEIQPSVVARVVNEGLSFKDTETLVHAIKDYPESKEDVLVKPINELTSPPTDIKEFIEKHGPEQPQFEQWKCPECGAEYTISWVWCEIRRRPEY